MKKNRHRRLPQRQKNESSHFFGDKDQQAAQPSDSAAFFQPKLEIDPVNSPAEKEADSVAQQVVNNPRSTGTSGGVQTKQVQRQGMEEEPAAKRIQKQEEEQAAAKRIQKQEEEQAAAKQIQKQTEEESATKLIQKAEEEEPAAKRIQRAEEEEAAAKRIQRMEEEEPAAKRIQRAEEEEPAAKRIQRAEEEEPAAKRIQKKEEAEQGGGKGIESMIQQTKGGGSPLPEAVRMEMEQQFGADFSRVRIHTGADAVEMTKALQAHAFTHGYDIYFNEGRFAPESKGGKELLAHELVHVVQQKGSGA